LVAAGGEGGKIGIWKVSDGHLLFTINTDSRVKALAVLQNTTQNSDFPYLVSAHSDGNVCFWNLPDCTLETKRDTYSRLTCMLVTNVQRKEIQQQEVVKVEEESEYEEEYQESKEGTKEKIKVIVEYEEEDDLAQIKGEQEDENFQQRAASDISGTEIKNEEEHLESDGDDQGKGQKTNNPKRKRKQKSKILKKQKVLVPLSNPKSPNKPLKSALKKVK
jgi:hypothetical protein